MTGALLCQHFPVCSGCSSIGVPYTEQLEAKLRAVREVFVKANLANFDPASIQKITPSDLTSGYRNRVKLVPSSAEPSAGADQSPDREGGARACASENATGESGGIGLGLYRAGTHQVVNMPDCPVQSESINRVVEVIRAGLSRFDIQLYDEMAHRGDLRFVSVREGFSTGEVLVGLVTRDELFPGGQKLADYLIERGEGVVGVVQNVNPEKGNVIFGRSSRLLAGRDYLEEIVCGVRIRLGMTSFFQINTKVAEAAYREMVAFLAGETAASSVAEADGTPPRPPLVQGGEEKRGRAVQRCGAGRGGIVDRGPAQADVTLLDLYAGVGTIGLVAAGCVLQVIGIEEVPEAVEQASNTATANGIANARFESALVEQRLPSLVRELGVTGVSPDEMVVAVNPPRKGLAGGVVDMLTEASPARIAYLSCNPFTLARDLVQFERGGYRVERVELFDMFPQTEQVETLALLAR